MVFTNAINRLFESKRKGLREIGFELAGIESHEISEVARTFKFKAREYINAQKYDKIMFLDCDCICITRPESMLLGEVDIMYLNESWSTVTDSLRCGYLSEDEVITLKRPRVNSGCWWTRGRYYRSIMEEWERVQQSEKGRNHSGFHESSWAKALLNSRLNAGTFSTDAVGFPLVERRPLLEYDAAVILHFAKACAAKVKLAHMIGFFTRLHTAEFNMALLDMACSW